MVLKMGYVIYVDGSYNMNKNLGGYGLVITKDNKSIYEEQKTLKDAGLSMRNVYGEIVGACRAVELAYKCNVNSITIAYDYEGIEKWATGKWKRKNEYTKKYYEYMQKMKKEIKINFLKVKAHSNNEFNEKADELAKIGAMF